MKKYVLMSLALMIGSFMFGQKKELKAAEKAIKDNNFASAKTALQNAGAMMSSMDDKSKAKYYYLKGQAYYANGAGSDGDITEALKSFEMMKDVEAKTGKKVYTEQANALQISMSNAFLDKAQSALSAKNHSSSSANFERAYRTSPADTLYLYNAALLATSSKEYDRAIDLYKELQDLGYTGIAMEYLATNVETGEEEKFPSQAMRDISVKAGTHEKARNEKAESKVGEIAKNVALIYIEQGKSDEALAAIEEAKKNNPKDFNLILSEANVRYKLGQIEEYTSLINEAIALDPKNADLYYNLGVVSSDQGQLDEAKKYYDMALEVDPNYTRAYMNMAALILDQEQGLIDQMNSLGTSAADNKKYDELQEDRLNLYRDAVPYLENALKQDKTNINAAKTLMNIYSVLGEDDKFKEMKMKVEEMESGN